MVAIDLTGKHYEAYAQMAREDGHDEVGRYVASQRRFFAGLHRGAGRH